MTKTANKLTIADKIVDYMNQYVAFPIPEQADTLALWVLHTHVFNTAYTTPYIYITAAERGCGKSRVREVLTEIAFNSHDGSNISGGALYALLGADAKPTLFMDEIDTVFMGNDGTTKEIRGMLNEGYKRSGKIMRQASSRDEDGRRETESYSVFAPKMLIGIDNGGMHDTTLSRCIPVVLKRRKADHVLRDFLIWEVEEEAAALKEEISEWAKGVVDRLAQHKPVSPGAPLVDRKWELAFPLMAVADMLGNGWHDRAKHALITLLSDEEQSLSPQAQILSVAKEWFDAHPTADRIKSETLATLVGLTSKKVAALLRPYEIKPGVMKIPGQGQQNHRCYLRFDFIDAWERYL